MDATALLAPVLEFAAAPDRREAEWREALDAAIAGDSDGLARLYDLAARELFALALWRSGRADLAEDAVQEVFCRLAAGGVKRSSPVERPRAWLLAAVHRSVIDRLRRARREVSIDEVISFVAAEDASAATLAHEVSSRLLELAPKLRAAVYLRCFADLSFAEIGRVTSVPTFTAASRYRLGLARLRRLLEVPR